MVPGWVADMQRIEVEDDEPKALFIGEEEDNGEGGNSVSRKGSVTILTPLSYDLVVDLFSDDPSKLVLPPFVIIPAGETMAFFDFAAAEPFKSDSRDVNVTASAPGWSRGEETIRVLN
jgi:hypothetical protein